MKQVEKATVKNTIQPKDIFVKYGFYIIFGILFTFYWISSSNFLTVRNISQVLMDATGLMIIASGMTIVVLLGDIDLSVGSVGFLSAALTCMAIKEMDAPIIIALLLGLTGAVIIGFINAFFITKIKMNTWLVTLGMMILLKGLSLTITDGSQIYIPDSLRHFGSYKIGGLLPVIVLIGLSVLIICQIMLKRTAYGRSLIAIGCDPKAAAKVGINVVKTRFTAFVLSALLAGFGGLITMINIGGVQPKQGQGQEFIAVAAVVMGGTSLFGGRGSFVPGALMGVLMIYIIENGLGLLGANAFAYPFVRGLVIFVAMYMDALNKDKAD